MVNLTNSEIRAISQKRKKDRERQEALISWYYHDWKEMTLETQVKELRKVFTSGGVFADLYDRRKELEHKYSAQKKNEAKRMTHLDD